MLAAQELPKRGQTKSQHIAERKMGVKTAGPSAVGAMRSNVAIVNDRFLWRSLVFVTALLFSIQGQAQQRRQTVRRHVRSAVSSGRAVSLGAMPSSQQLNLSIVLPLRNESELADLLVRLYDPSSPEYHRFLTAAQFTEQFSPSAQDYETVGNFARANGFTVTGAPTNRLLVPIRGTVGQIEKTFHVTMKLYQHPTENRIFFSPDQEPSLDLNVRVAHIAGLNNFSIPRSMAINVPAKLGSTTAAGSGSGPGGSFLGSDIRAAYYGGTTLTGSGQSVGLAEFDGYNLSDVNSVFSNVGQSYSVPINNVLLDGATGNACQFQPLCSDAEQVLDIAQAIGMAPGLDQVRVYIGNLDTDILNAMASENVAKQLSISWGWTPDDPATDDIFFEEFAAQGQSVFVASGDYGAFEPIFPYYFPAEDAYITAVGGTVLFTNGAGGAWSQEWGWGGGGRDGSGGGISPDGIPIPSWQAGVANSANQASTTLRNVPDVAMEANTDNYNCDMGTCAGTWGGTSFAAPRWATYIALVNQQALASGSPSVGFINPGIYAIGKGSTYGSDFHDITVGDDNVYFAEPGYDLVTGWGSPAGQNLIEAMAPPPSGGFYLSASLSSLSINPSASGTTTITVNGQAGFSGSVNFAVTSVLPSGVTASFDPNPTNGSSVLTLTVNDSAIRGSYLLTVTGTSGALAATVDVALEVNAPGFTILPSSGVLAIFPGTSGSIPITVTNYSGFAGSVDLAVTSPLPSGVTAYWTPGPSNGVSILTLSASNSAAPVRTVLTITGICGALTATTTFPFEIDFPSPIINLSPIPNSIVQGGSATGTVTVVPIGNYTGPVTLYAYQLPAGVTAMFNPNPTNSTSEVTLSASSSATLGEFWTNIENFLFPVTITATPTPSLGVGISPAFLTMTQGETATGTITVTELNGLTGNVTLQAQPPSGVTATFGTNPTTGTSSFSLTASSSAPVGTFWVPMIGINGTQAWNSYLFLTLNPAPAFTVTASPVNLAQSSTITSAVTVVPQPGFAGSVNLSTSALPTGISGTFSPNPATGSSVLTLTADSTASLGNYPVIIAGTSGTRTITTVVSLLVGPAGTPTTTHLSITPGGGALTAGAPYTLTATVVPAIGSTAPSGNISFNVGPATQIAALNSGVATYTGTAPPTAGSFTLSAGYQGTAAFAASTSNTLNETITLPVSPSFNVSGTPVTLSPGAITGNTSTITVTPAGGFTGSVAMTASITSSPAGAQHPPTLSFGSTTPVSVTDTNPHTATLTVSTTAASSSFTLYTLPGRPSRRTTWGITLACILLSLVLSRQRNSRSGFAMLVPILMLAGGMLACGTSSSSTGGTNNPGTTAGVYTITVTGTSGTSTATSMVTLRVQ